MFLQLLVAQLQHQDPTSPVDPSQFVGQLAQFSELSEVTSIYQLLQQVVPASGGSGSSGGTSPGGGSTQAAPNFVSPALSALTSRIQGVF
jgi:flagellar hook assembly protein FlgD